MAGFYLVLNIPELFLLMLKLFFIMKELQTMKRFGWVAVAEGISYLVLLLIAMPVKYLLHEPVGTLLVKYVGWAHGVLFVLYVFLLFLCMMKYSWRFGKTALYFLLSLIPFGTFWVDKKLKEETALLRSLPLS